MPIVPNPLKWHGGKRYLASKIVALMPPRCKNPNKPSDDDPGYLHYVEPFAGGLSVLLANNPEGISEVVNDINGDLINFWGILASDEFDGFRERIQATPFSEAHWEGAKLRCAMEKSQRSMDRVGYAINFFIWCRQSLAGRMTGFTGVTKTRTRRGMNNEVSAWLTAIEGLPQVHERLKRVLILNRDALEVIRSQDGPRTLFYLDPPYLHETRTTTTEYGDYEMTPEQHQGLLDTLAEIKGRFILSGYNSEMYDVMAKKHRWNRTDWVIDNKASGAKTKRVMIESCWRNYSVG